MGDWRIEGSDELMQSLLELEPTPAQLNTMLRDAAQPVESEMKALAPRGKTGILKSGIGIGSPKATKGGGRAITIGVHRKDFPVSDPDEYYPAYVEFGHGGPPPAPAHPFVRPAYESTKDLAYQILKDKLAKK